MAAMRVAKAAKLNGLRGDRLDPKQTLPHRVLDSKSKDGNDKSSKDNSTKASKEKKSKSDHV
jgi:hypothetical protein